MTSTTVAATIGAIMLTLDALLIIGGTGLLTAALTWGGA